MGISSIKRTSHGCFRVRSRKSPISPSLNPPMRTVSSFKWVNPAASAARMPARGSARCPRRVSHEKRSGRRVSRLIFSRSTPASRRGLASSGKRLPFVVRRTAQRPFQLQYILPHSGCARAAACRHPPAAYSIGSGSCIGLLPTAADSPRSGRIGRARCSLHS